MWEWKRRRGSRGLILEGIMILTFFQFSILASNFADQLNDIFLINDTLDELSQSVENKYAFH